MSQIVSSPRAISPVRFPAWGRTRAAFVQALQAGPGLLCLVGGAGSGKTYTLMLYKMSATDLRVAIRTPDVPADPAVDVDLVDDVTAEDAAILGQELRPGLRRVLAMAPGALAGLPNAGPAARIVRVRPMDPIDVRTMVAGRITQMGIPPETAGAGALTKLVELSDGTPRQVDRLLGASLRLAFIDDKKIVSAHHVVTAANALAHAVARPKTARPNTARPMAATASPEPEAADVLQPAVAPITAEAILAKLGSSDTSFLRPSRKPGEPSWTTVLEKQAPVAAGSDAARLGQEAGFDQALLPALSTPMAIELTWAASMAVPVPPETPTVQPGAARRRRYRKVGLVAASAGLVLFTAAVVSEAYRTGKPRQLAAQTPAALPQAAPPPPAPVALPPAPPAPAPAAPSPAAPAPATPALAAPASARSTPPAQAASVPDPLPETMMPSPARVADRPLAPTRPPAGRPPERFANARGRRAAQQRAAAGTPAIPAAPTSDDAVPVTPTQSDGFPAARNPVLATRLLGLARTMQAAGQSNEAADMFRAAAALGNTEAAAQLRNSSR